MRSLNLLDIMADSTPLRPVTIILFPFSLSVGVVHQSSPILNFVMYLNFVWILNYGNLVTCQNSVIKIGGIYILRAYFIHLFVYVLLHHLLPTI